ncbi:hypothetical protein SMD11_3185 [Streptomyces albireticuli]|uniref:Uncharacterized protein n=1 Tax=Streptomyces albireticuli TaxID=1940 RepID=A0A1Z2L3F9_9ACTN|nr:hypothetical protein SMD11_3185 [Streptomyces albireticuli]
MACCLRSTSGKDVLGETAGHTARDALGDRPPGQTHAVAVLVDHRIASQLYGIHAHKGSAAVETAHLQDPSVRDTALQPQLALRADEPEDQPCGLEVGASPHVP